MKFSISFALIAAATFCDLANGQMLYELVGDGVCAAETSYTGTDFLYDYAFRVSVFTIEECDNICRRSINYSDGLRGFSFNRSYRYCRCEYDEGTAPGNDLGDPFCPDTTELQYCYDQYWTGAGELESTAYPGAGWSCHRYTAFPVPSIPVPSSMSFVGHGFCKAPEGTIFHDYTVKTYAGFNDYDPQSPGFTLDSCSEHCQAYPQGLRGLSYEAERCYCFYDDEYAPGGSMATEACPSDITCEHSLTGQGEIEQSTGAETQSCWKYNTNTEANGDPHFRTWKNEHFEFHGQCDLVMTKVQNFGNQGIDLDIHLRTKMIRYWSYIKSVAIRIGNDILEVEGSAAKEDGEEKRHYRINYEYRGPLETVGGFPVTISPRNNKYTIDLDSAFPGQKIEIKTFKEFVGVKIIGATEESFGNAVGITGNFQTGKTLARDGHSEIHDFSDLGLEWQVMPSDGKLFHDAAKPQFPELCYLPEDPRGERARRLAESNITEEAAEEACAGLKDEFDRKGCVYDILATQDMDMVGAY